MFSIYILIMALVAGIYIYNWKNTRLMFCVFLFASAGLGSFYNELFQIAGTVVPSDLFMLGFMTSWFFFNNNKFGHIKRRTTYIWLIFVYMLLLSVASLSPFGQILRDVKVFLYFFVAYVYLKQKRDDEKLKKYILATFALMIIFAIIACAYNFITYGLEGLSTGKVDRTFGLGISQYGLAIFFVLLLAVRNKIKGKICLLLYYVVQVLILVVCIVSYTRSVWLQLIISINAYYFLKIIFSKKREKMKFGEIIRLIIIGGVCVVLAGTLVQRIPDLNNIILNRFNTIYDSGGSTDTLAFRLNEVKTFINIKFMNIRILFGYGFGDMLAGQVSGIIENSFVYYSWKYGLILSAVLYINVLKCLLNILRKRDRVNIAVFCSLLVYYISGGMSGHLNKYYVLPLIATLMILNFSSDKKQQNVGNTVISKIKH